MPLRWTFLLPVLLCLAALAGCGGGSENDTNAAAPSASAPTAGTSATAESPAAKLTPADGDKVPATPQPGLARGLDVGIGDQGTGFFSAPLFRALGIKRARLAASYDTVDVGFDRELADAWLKAARKAGVEPLVALNHSRKSGRQDHLPSVAEYRKAFRAFHRRYPEVRVYTPWNEPNNKGQPTADHPDRVAEYTDVVARECPDCTIVAGDVQDQRGAVDWIRRFRAALKVKPRIWGVHNYSDVNRFRTSGLEKLERVMPGDIWLTETGGVARFGGSFPLDFQRQARAFNYLFVTARADRRIKRVYLYNWTGAGDKGFDAGLTNADGSPRPAYEVVKTALGR